MFVTGGTKFLFRIALSILYLSQATLLQCEFEEIIGYLKNLPDDGILNPDILLPIACDYFQVSNGALSEIEKRYEADCRESEEARERRERREQAKASPVAAAVEPAASAAQRLEGQP